MDKNTIIGLTLIFVLFVVWQRFTAPTAEERAAQQRMQDSIALVQQQAEQEAAEAKQAPTANVAATDTTSGAMPDSLVNQRLVGEFGPFAAAATGVEEDIILENDLMQITFSNKGGKIKEVWLKNFYKVREDERKKEIKEDLKLLEDEKNKFDYLLPIANIPSGFVNTADLYFTAEQQGNTISFKADAGNGRYFEQKYTIEPGTYMVDYDVHFEGLQNLIAGNAEEIELNWLNYLDKLEKNSKYERNYSSIYYKVGDDTDYCSCTSDDQEDINGKAVKWVSNANQFFNSALVAEGNFNSASLDIQIMDQESEDLKRLQSRINIPYGHSPSETFAMNFYIGPNEFDRLYAFGEDLEDVIPFGRSIFGSINRWIIRPIFNFLSTFIGSKGIVILVLTLMVKLVFYPLTYKMLYSQSKMGALKPRLEGLKSKYKDDPQQQQMETMKIYREHGVNPLGGCLPMVVQMPIWFALYRFFPAAIEFRQAPFLWATDLSSYDVLFNLPFTIPFFGSHLSLFTLLWAVTTLIYTYYNTKHMDMSANPAMKYMQYLMPIFFLGFFNSFASGLTCYLFFSNLINITQTIVTKNYIIDKDKILAGFEEYKKKPKKKSGFSARLEAAMKEQQKLQAQKQAQGKKGNKSKKGK